MKALILFFLALGLSACGDIPQPFRHEEIPELARPLLVRAITIRPIASFDPGTSSASFDLGTSSASFDLGTSLTEALVKVMADRNIPAIVHGDIPGSAILVGKFEPNTSDLAPLEIEWVLTSPDRPKPLSFHQKIPRKATPAILAELATQVVDELTADSVDAAPPAPAAKGRLSVRLVTHATLPGYGNASLIRAMRSILERNGILVVAEGGDYVVELKGAVTNGPNGQDMLNVSWVVAKPDGAPLGNVDQQGAVPTGTLAGPWGPLSHSIANGGASGIVQVVETHSRAALQK